MVDVRGCRDRFDVIDNLATGTPEDLCSLSRVCKTLHLISGDDYLWVCLYYHEIMRSVTLNYGSKAPLCNPEWPCPPKQNKKHMYMYVDHIYPSSYDQCCEFKQGRFVTRVAENG